MIMLCTISTILLLYYRTWKGQKSNVLEVGVDGGDGAKRLDWRIIGATSPIQVHVRMTAQYTPDAQVIYSSHLGGKE